jgi:hypothetical protein
MFRVEFDRHVKIWQEHRWFQFGAYPQGMGKIDRLPHQFD